MCAPLRGRFVEAEQTFGVLEFGRLLVESDLLVATLVSSGRGSTTGCMLLPPRSCSSPNKCHSNPRLDNARGLELILPGPQ